MLYAARDIVDSGGMDVGRLLVLLGFGEETKNTTMAGAVEEAGEIDAAVIGEPTGLDFAIAQRGLLMIDLLAQGDQRHAAYAGNEDGFTNAVQLLARDLIKLDTVFQGRTHPLLGRAIATATMIEGGVGRNITAPVARAVLDIRSTPDWTHEELAAELRAMLTSDVIVTSRRLTPCETPSSSRLLATASRLRPEAAHFGSPTCSDWVFFGDRDSIKCGPGTSRRSHTADEYVDIPEVTAARAFYGELVRAYLSGH
jgi:acetylornithine deacetylase